MDQANACRGCRQTTLLPIALGASAPPAAPRKPGESRESAPQRLALCTSCALVQAINTAPCGPSSSKAPIRPELSPWQARQLASQVTASQKLRPTSLVLEIGSRDGYLLKEYKAVGIPVLGIEPAIRLAELARLENGVPTLCRHFSRTVASSLQGCDQLADVVHAHHVLPSLVDLDGFLAGLAIVLKPSGVCVVEVPYVKSLVERRELAVPPHRQRSYFSMTALVRLFGRHGLIVHDVEQTPESGSTLRLFVGRSGQTSARVTRLMHEETAWGVDRVETYAVRENPGTPPQRRVA